jgi:hypothetical protein
MHIVGTWLALERTQSLRRWGIEDVFYEYLAEELIENEYDSFIRTRIRRRRQGDDSFSASPDAIGHEGSPKSGMGVYLTPTKKRRKSNGGMTKYSA